MSAFDFVLILLSFVYALALAVVLQSIGRLVVERHRVKFCGLLALAMLNALVTVYISWLGMWDFRDTKGINLYDVTTFFVAALLIYLLCVAVSPEPDEAGEVDMEAFFWTQVRFFYGTFLALLLTWVATTVIYLRTPHPQLFYEQGLADLPGSVVGLAGLLSRNRWLQWAVGVLILAMSILWGVAFSSSF